MQATIRSPIGSIVRICPPTICMFTSCICGSDALTGTVNCVKSSAARKSIHNPNLFLLIHPSHIPSLIYTCDPPRFIHLRQCRFLRVDGCSSGTDGFSSGTDGFSSGTDGFSSGTDGFSSGTDGLSSGSDGCSSGFDGFSSGLDGFLSGFFDVSVSFDDSGFFAPPDCLEESDF